ncbi:CENPC protein, partial [Centropus unirufus]|nr:CENPC protein [Centropus unirufus]
PEKEKTESKKSKNRKAQVKALTKQKTDDLDVEVRGCKRTLELDPVSNNKAKARKSQRQSSTHTGKTKRTARSQVHSPGSPNQENNMSCKPEVEELMLSWSALETKATDAEQCKTRVMPNEDLPVHSAGHQQEQTVSSKKKIKSSKQLQSASKASQPLVHKKKPAKQKLPKDNAVDRFVESPRKKLKESGKISSNKKSRIRRVESSDSELGEEGVEREPVKLSEVFSSPLHQKLQTPMVQKLSKSGKPKNVSHALESPGGANKKTAVEELQHPVDSVKDSKKRKLSAKSSGKMPKKFNRQISKGVCSNPEDAEPQADSDGSHVQDTARKKQKLPAVKVKNRKRKIVFFYVFSDYSEDLNYQLRGLLSDDVARRKIVMPSNTPNVRRTKRIRLRPLEYWRGERVNYAMRPSGGLVISGIVCPEPEPHRKIKPRKNSHKQKTDEMNQIPIKMDETLGDTSKPTVVLDPETNQEVLLECINTQNMNSIFFKDDSVEVYKNLNTSDFAAGRLVLKPLKEKGHQFVCTDTLAFYVIHGKIILTLHETSYYLTTGDYFYIPAGNGYNIRNLMDEETVLLFTQLK